MIARSVGTFVQVGEAALNMALVVEIKFGAGYVHLYCSPRESNDSPIVLRDDEYLAFLDWWEHQAELTRLTRAAQLLQLASHPPSHSTRPPNTSVWKVTPGTKRTRPVRTWF